MQTVIKLRENRSAAFECRQELVNSIKLKIRNFLAYRELFSPLDKLSVGAKTQLQAEWGEIFLMLQDILYQRDKNEIFCYFCECVEEKERMNWKVLQNSPIAMLRYYFREKYYSPS